MVDADDAILLPDEHSAVAGPGQAHRPTRGKPGSLNTWPRLGAAGTQTAAKTAAQSQLCASRRPVAASVDAGAVAPLIPAPFPCSYLPRAAHRLPRGAAARRRTSGVVGSQKKGSCKALHRRADRSVLTGRASRQCARRACAIWLHAPATGRRGVRGATRQAGDSWDSQAIPGSGRRVPRTADDPGRAPCRSSPPTSSLGIGSARSAAGRVRARSAASRCAR